MTTRTSTEPAPPADPAEVARAATIRRYVPWIVASALFMEQLDATIVNTGIPSMAAELGTTPLALKSVSASYVLALAVCIPASGWLANRLGTRRVFLTAIMVFTLASLACGLAPSVGTLVACRVLQGMAAALMMPVGRMAVVRTFPKAQLLQAMNFVIIPALMGPLLGPTVGGLIVHWGSWREMFFVNVPVGLIALAFGLRHMPDYRGDPARPFDLPGLVLFGGGTALLSWVLEVFGAHGMATPGTLVWLGMSLVLIAAYVWHARGHAAPLMNFGLMRVRTFRVSVIGGFVTRLGIGGMPFLLPLLYQVGMGLPAWHSGLLMMPAAAAAMVMKTLAQKLLARWGYRRILTVNTVLVAGCIGLFALVGRGTPTAVIVALGLSMGLFNSLQFTSMNSMAYSDLAERDTADGSTIASTFQQLSMSFGLAVGSLVAGWFLSHQTSTDPQDTVRALHRAFLVMAGLTLCSSWLFRTLDPHDGDSVSRPGAQDPGADGMRAASAATKASNASSRGA